MKSTLRSFRGAVASATLLVVLGLGSSARGDENCQITDPTDNSSVTVGPGSAEMPVKFTLASGFLPTSVKLIIPDGMGA